MEALTIALPKGRLFKQVQKHFLSKGIEFDFEERKLICEDSTGSYCFYLVRNSDLPTYVTNGIAGMGICGDDVIYESGKSFNKLHQFDFGGSRLSLAGPKGISVPPQGEKMTIATSYTQMTEDYYHSLGTPVDIIKLKGSVELAPSLGLAPFIVDLVETGNTLRANGLEVLEDLFDIKVHLISNKSYFKLHYDRIARLLELLS